MKLLSAPKLSPLTPCPYLSNRDSAQEYFFATELNIEEIDLFLSTGWRKFGAYYFRPNCPTCESCLPLRVPVTDFTLNKKQRRILRKNEDIVIERHALEFNQTYYDLFEKHSKKRFNQNESEIGNEEQFIDTFFISSCPSFILTYKLNEKVIAWGILDYGQNSLSSVYFVFDPDFENRSLGHFSVLKEIEYAREHKLKYYYLGYYVPGNKSMEYKSKYTPHEIFSWKNKTWNLEE
ncbi:hypothetical protein A9Q84_12050 [Halobacteriovorax marinus]|uniref:Aspartate/glutamate leucyltransferase n=1 Tax=Halobacteriovorax marinus TaxID=97084 RepID=A0A1Y5F7Z1_9BACT|nr:hypothetical protein A9Q84_12050 [Halobacteriovorax marinus]